MADLLEHFPGRFPTEVFEELTRLPVGFLFEVIEAKNYRRAKAMSDAADTPEARKRLPRDGLFARVTEIEFALAAEEREAQAHGR